VTTVLACNPPSAAARCADVIKRHGGELLGPSGLARFDGPAQAIECGLVLAAERAVGVGVHSGECTRSGDRIEGYAVNLARRVADAAPAGEVLVTETVKDLLAGSRLDAAPRHSISMNDAKSWALFRVLTITHQMR